MYQLHPLGVVRLDDNACIPSDPGNRDWNEYQTWLAAGGSPAPMPVAAPVKTAADRLQAVLAMSAADRQTLLNKLLADYVG